MCPKARHHARAATVRFTIDAGSGTIYAGTDRGVFISTDNASSFAVINMNFELVYSMAFDSSSSIYAGTHSYGLVSSGDGFNKQFTFALIPRFFPGV